ncbi:MAG: hypothetical protein ACREF9_18885 [Opitutaceae bacterium]
MNPSRTRSAALVAVLTALATAACADSLDLDGPHDALTADIGATVRDEVEAAVGALTVATLLAPIGTTQAAGEAAFLMVTCVTPSSNADADGDGVPDDAIYLFTAPPCRYTGWRGGTLDIVGQLRLQDPTPSSAGFGYEATITDLRSRFSSADNKVMYDVTRNGTRTLSGSTAGLLLTAELQVKRTFAGHPDAAIDKEWAVNYTPAAPLQINGTLPTGSLDIAGTVDWLRGDEHFALVLTTPTPLHYNGDCTDTVQRIDGGELHAAGTFDDIEGSVRLRWSECGREPSFSFEAAE